MDWAEIIDLSDYDSSSGESFDPSLDDSSLSDGSSVYSFDLAADVKGGDVPSTRKPIQLPLSYDDSSSDEDSIGSSIGSNPTARSAPTTRKKKPNQRKGAGAGGKNGS